MKYSAKVRKIIEIYKFIWSFCEKWRDFGQLLEKIEEFELQIIGGV